MWAAPFCLIYSMCVRLHSFFLFILIYRSYSQCYGVNCSQSNQSPVHHWATWRTKQPSTNAFIPVVYLDWTISWTCMFGIVENKTHTHTERTYKLYTERPLVSTRVLTCDLSRCKERALTTHPLCDLFIVFNAYWTVLVCFLRYKKTNVLRSTTK